MNMVEDRYHGLPDYSANYLWTCQNRARKRTDPKTSWQKRVRSRGGSPKPGGFGSFAKLEEDLALLHGLTRLDMNRTDDAGGHGPEFILHFHRLQHHQSGPGANALPGLYLDPDDQSRHRCLEDSPSAPHPGRGSEPANVPGSLIHDVDFDDIASETERPVTALAGFNR